MQVISSSIIYQHLPVSGNVATSNRRCLIHAHQSIAIEPPHQHEKSNRVTTGRLAESLSNFLHLHIERKELHHVDQISLDHGSGTTPTSSPKEDISAKWLEIHGSWDWSNLLDPLHPWLRREIIKYGEFAQAAYDAFDFDSFSEYCGSCRYNPKKLFDKLGLSKSGYMVSKYIFAMSHIEMPRWLQRSHLVDET
uniref:Phospholipase A1-Igamma1, chloroplastic-like n=1 Tax=Nelumbo nucifera TaxID=4432 RepID=A0A822YP92_NELNU|nr:TPA_asm: hypothetical protein HUJ06_012774 [Nelumbo nucifera]